MEGVELVGGVSTATLEMNAAPPGWNAAKRVKSYTLSSMITQLLSGEACLATSSRVYTAVIAVESGEKKAAGAGESDRPERRVSSARFCRNEANRRTIVEREKATTLFFESLRTRYGIDDQ